MCCLHGPCLQLQDWGAVTMGDVLRVNTALTHLNLSHNNIHHLGSVNLALSIQYNSVLQTLDLSGNLVEVQNMVMLLRNLVSIRHLGLRGIQPREKCIWTLDAAIKDNSALRVLDLRDNGFSSLMFQNRHQDNPGMEVLV